MATTTPVRAKFDSFVLDEANARLLRDGLPIPLPPKPFALLCALVRSSGSLLTKHQLLDTVWGHQFVSDSVLKTSISDVRTALDDDPRRPRYIETVSRRGYRFIAATTALAAAPPMTASTAEADASMPFVGRAAEMAQLRRAWDQACAGEHKVVFVAGEPGIGKTALIERFIASLANALCIRGQCVDQFGTGEPYLPVLEALADLCRNDSTLTDLLRSVAPAWLLQLPWLSTPDERERLRHELAGAAPDRMLREIGELLARCAERRPLLLVTEDLHWGDRATVQLIDYVARRRGRARFMWIATFRLAEVIATDHPLRSVRHELRLHGLCEEIVLDAFSETEVAACVALQSLSLANDEAFVRALHERTDGVPLFVTSVMREVAGEGEREARDAAQAARRARTAVPQNLAGIVDRYIARLEQSRRELLNAASVLGAEFRVTALARVLGRDAASVEQACEDLAREQLWLAVPRSRKGGATVEPRYAFSHAIFRQVLYERTAPLARAQLHRTVAETLKRERTAGVHVPAAELAVHFERAGDASGAIRYYIEAAQSALQHLTPMDALELAEHASSMLDEVAAGEERDSVELTLATLRGVSAFQVLGVGEETRAALGRAYSLLEREPQHPMRGLALHGFGWVLSLRAEYEEALAVAERAESLAASSQDSKVLLAAATVQATVHMLQGHPSEARTWIERVLGSFESVDGARESFAADPVVTLLAMLGLQLLHLGHVRQGRQRLDQALARAREVQQPMSQLVALWYQAMFELRLGRAATVKQVGEDMWALVEKFSLSQGRAASHWFRGWADARLGLPREGHEQIRAAHEDDRRFGMNAAASENLGYAAEALLLAGDLAAAQQALDEALAAADQHSERIYLPQLHLIQAAIAQARGEPVAAEDSIRRALAEARSQQARWLELTSLLQLCESGRASAADMEDLSVLLDALPEAAGTDAAARARVLLARRDQTSTFR